MKTSLWLYQKEQSNHRLVWKIRGLVSLLFLFTIAISYASNPYDSCHQALRIPIQIDPCLSDIGFKRLGLGDATSSEVSNCSFDTPTNPNDIWIKAAVLSQNTMIKMVQDTTTSSLKPIIEVYAGSCGSTLIKCDSIYTFPHLSPITGLTPGTDIFIRIYDSLNSNSANDSIGLYLYKLPDDENAWTDCEINQKDNPTERAVGDFIVQFDASTPASEITTFIEDEIKDGNTLTGRCDCGDKIALLWNVMEPTMLETVGKKARKKSTNIDTVFLFENFVFNYEEVSMADTPTVYSHNNAYSSPNLSLVPSGLSSYNGQILILSGNDTLFNYFRDYNVMFTIDSPDPTNLMQAFTLRVNEKNGLYSYSTFASSSNSIESPSLSGVTVSQEINSSGLCQPFVPYTPTGGCEAKISIIDSGIDDDNPDFQNAFSESIEDDCVPTTRVGYDFKNKTATIKDPDGHGTLVNGVVLNDYPSDLNLGLLNGKFFEGGRGTLFDAVCAIHHAINNKVPVINLSFGVLMQREIPTLLKEALDRAWEEDILIVTSAGNYSSDLDQLTADGINKFPAVYDRPNIIVVGAYEIDNNADSSLASYSNFGTNEVDLAAIGCFETHQGDTAAGTSLASPWVARTASIIRANYPGLTFTDVKDCILNTAQDVAGLRVAKGILNHEAALNRAASMSLEVSGIICGGLPNISDPCNCFNPKNINRAGVTYFHDILKVCGLTPGETVQLTENRGNHFLNINLNPIATGTVLGTADASGCVTYEFWHAFGEQAVVRLESSGGAKALFGSSICIEVCPMIPTFSQWGLLIFGLLICNLGVWLVLRIKAIQ